MPTDLTLEMLDDAYNKAMLGPDTQETVLWAASGLRQIADRMEGPSKKKWIDVADKCPAGCVIMMSQGGKITYFDPDKYNQI